MARKGNPPLIQLIEEMGKGVACKRWKSIDQVDNLSTQHLRQTEGNDLGNGLGAQDESKKEHSVLL
jgi:hypothetical protein